MIETLIVADDLTGANATGSLLAKQGRRVGTLMDQGNLQSLADFDVLAVTTDSRGSSSKTAKARVSQVMETFKETKVGFFNKRIDSTLRGNVGAEIDGMLGQLDPATIAIVVAAFPNSGRISSGGYLLVNGIPLEQTGVANDPTSPVTQSKIEKIIASQTNYPLGYIDLETVMSSQATLEKALLEQVQVGNRIIVIDACTNQDIAAIAKTLKTSPFPFITVDPGPLTAALAHLSPTPVQTEPPSAKLLFVVGSATELSRQQLAYFRQEYAPLTIKLTVLNFLTPITRDQEIKKAVARLLTEWDNYDTFLLATNLVAGDILDLKVEALKLNLSLEAASDLITQSLAEITYQLLTEKSQQLPGVYLSGGDVTVAFCDKVQALGVEVLEEILPLAVYGQLIGGEQSGQVIVTKGGLVGDVTALTTCARYLETRLSQQEVG